MKKTADQSSPVFPAKLLLFGEYTILHGGDALAIPLPAFTGALRWSSHKSPDKLHKMLLDTLQKFLSHLGPANRRIIHIAKTLMDELGQGLRFETNIPTGYGLGSSGVLTAAMYTRYVESIDQDHEEIQTNLAEIESIFHGRSSGLDPLVSFTQRPVMMSNGQALILPENRLKMVCPVMLADTLQPRSTSAMVARFHEMCNDPVFSAVLRDQLIPLQNRVVKAWIQGKSEEVFFMVKELSVLQWKYMQAMIPESSHELWEKCLDHDYPLAVKILGAGGGGFMLLLYRHPQRDIKKQHLTAEHTDTLHGLPVIRL